MGLCEEDDLGVSCNMGQCGHFEEQGLPVGVRECLEETARMVKAYWRRRVLYLCWQNL